MLSACSRPTLRAALLLDRPPSGGFREANAETRACLMSGTLGRSQPGCQTSCNHTLRPPVLCEDLKRGLKKKNGKSLECFDLFIIVSDTDSCNFQFLNDVNKQESHFQESKTFQNQRVTFNNFYVQDFFFF